MTLPLYKAPSTLHEVMVANMQACARRLRFEVVAVYLPISAPSPAIVRAPGIVARVGGAHYFGEAEWTRYGFAESHGVGVDCFLFSLCGPAGSFQALSFPPERGSASAVAIPGFPSLGECVREALLSHATVSALPDS